MKKLNIMGRSRIGVIKVPKCSVKLVLEEKPNEEFYRQIIKGETPKGLAEQFKNVIF